MARVEFKKLYEDSILPRKAHESDAGFDLCAHSVMTVNPEGKLEAWPLGADSLGMWILTPGMRVLVKCGFGMALPQCYEAQVRPRSGLALKRGIAIVNSPGTIDAGYRNEVGVILLNTSGQDFDFKPGERIAQMVIQKLPDIEAVEVDELSNPSDRGQAGFGSTGV